MNEPKQGFQRWDEQHEDEQLPKLDADIEIFARRRVWLGESCRIAARLLADAYAATLPGGKPGLILFAQTSGFSKSPERRRRVRA
jgi:hypothetical protein